MKINYKLELSSASLHTWNDGMASLGQIDVCGGIKLSIVNCQLSIVNEPVTQYHPPISPSPQITHLTHLNRVLPTRVNKIKIQEDKTMKKTYRLTIDYMIEINEKVQVDGEYSRELIEKTRHIMNAFFLAPEVLLEYNKDRFYEGFLDVDPWNNDLGELLGIKEQHEYMKPLIMHLPSNTIPYFQALFGNTDRNIGTEDYSDEGMNLCIDQFGKPIPLHASFKEIEDIDCLSLDKKMNCPGLENCKLVQSIIEFLHQGARCA
jgi:hypothetical protein